MGGNRTALFARHQAGGVFTIEDVIEHPGNIWFVDSGCTAGADSDGYGKNPDAPFLTLDYAIGKCTASNGDVIYVMPGHAETLTTAGDVTVDVVGVAIVGLGKGASRPTFTMGSTDNAASVRITAAGAWLENLLFVTTDDGLTNVIKVEAADCTLEDIELRDSTSLLEAAIGILTTAAADRLTIENLDYNGGGGDACTAGISLVGVNKALLKNCRFHGVASTAWINFATTACTMIDIVDCIFANTGTALTKNVVDSVGGTPCTWLVTNGYDLVGGYRFRGGSGSALAADDTATIVTTLGTPADGDIATDIANLVTTVGTPAGTDVSTDIAALATTLGTPAGGDLATDVAALATTLGTPANVDVSGDIAAVATLIGTPANVDVSGDIAAVVSTLGTPADTDVSTDIANLVTTVGTPADTDVSTDIAAVKADVVVVDGIVDDIKAGGGLGSGIVRKSTTFANTSTDVNLFTVTGDVIVRLVAVCGTNVASAAGCNISVKAGATAIIAETDATLLAAGDIWHDASPDAGVEAVDVLGSFIIAGGLDIALDVQDAKQLDSGVVNFYCFWTALSADGAVVSAA